MSADPPKAVPILGYATRAADGVPEFHGEAEELLDAGGSPNDLRRYFVQTEDALKYFARSMTRRYAPEMAGKVCCICIQLNEIRILQLKWFADVNRRFFEYHLREENLREYFYTHHAFCDACLNRWTVRLARFAQIRRVLHWLAVSISAAWLLCAMVDRREKLPLGPLFWVVIGAWIISIGGQIILNKMGRRHWPVVMHAITDMDCTLVGMSDILDPSEFEIVDKPGVDNKNYPI